MDVTAVGWRIPPHRFGALVRSLRLARGDTPDGLAARSGGRLDAERLRAIESGDIAATPDEIRLLAGLLAFQLGELVPRRMKLVLDVTAGRGVVGTGDLAAPLAPVPTIDDVLMRYLELVWFTRGEPPGTAVRLRQGDLGVLGDALGIGRVDVAQALADLIEAPGWVDLTAPPPVVVPDAGILVAGVPAGTLVLLPDPDVEEPGPPGPRWHPSMQEPESNGPATAEPPGDATPGAAPTVEPDDTDGSAGDGPAGDAPPP